MKTARQQSLFIKSSGYASLAIGASFDNKSYLLNYPSPLDNSWSFKVGTNRQQPRTCSTLTCLNKYRAEIQSHLSFEQGGMIAERLLFARKRGFAADVLELKLLKARIACLNGRPYKNGLPSDETIRLFRAKPRELSLRNMKRKIKRRSKENPTIA